MKFSGFFQNYRSIFSIHSSYILFIDFETRGKKWNKKPTIKNPLTIIIIIIIFQQKNSKKKKLLFRFFNLSFFTKRENLFIFIFSMGKFLRCKFLERFSHSFFLASSSTTTNWSDVTRFIYFFPFVSICCCCCLFHFFYFI